MTRSAPTALVLLTAALAAGLATGCAAPPPAPAPGRITGRVESGASLSDEARVALYQVDPRGLLVPHPSGPLVPDSRGHFATGLVAPGRYALVLRSPDHPPALANVTVPLAPDAVLRPLPDRPVAELVLAAWDGAPTPVTVRLHEARSLEPVPDCREATLAEGAAKRLRGLAPGLYHLDVPGTGATTDVAVWRDEVPPLVRLTPPPPTGPCEVFGTVIDRDGAPAPGLAVSVRALREPHSAAAPWGRYAITDAAGRYRVTGVPEGAVLVRVERREVPYRLLPPPERISIPPSGKAERGFVVVP